MNQSFTLRIVTPTAGAAASNGQLAHKASGRGQIDAHVQRGPLAHFNETEAASGPS